LVVRRWSLAASHFRTWPLNGAAAKPRPDTNPENRTRYKYRNLLDTSGVASYQGFAFRHAAIASRPKTRLGACFDLANDQRRTANDLL
jgi:hypothetical protein